MKPLTLSITSLLLALESFAAAPSSLSDADISKRLVGTWRTPPDSWNYERDKYSIEIYEANGTNITIWYADPACKKIANKLTGRWMVQGGWLVSTLPNGIKFQDKILNIEGDKISILDDGQAHAHSMQKGTFCAVAVS